MHKFWFVSAGLCLAVAIYDLRELPGTRAHAEAGYLLLAAPVLALVGLWARGRALRRCPSCAEWIRREAHCCRYCGAGPSNQP